MLKELWDFLQPVLNVILKNLDPSLFQNVILGMLAIFIPFAIVLRPNDEFEKMVFTEEVVSAKKLFWFSVIGLSILSLFASEVRELEVSFSGKSVAVLLTVFLIWLFWNSFRKVLRFSGGYKSEFGLSFLRGLKLSSTLCSDRKPHGNQATKEKMLKAWESFWSEKTERDEGEFTEVFVGHVDTSIKAREFDFAVQLLLTYQYGEGLEKRGMRCMGDKVFPKVLEWLRFSFNDEHANKDLYPLLESDFFPQLAKTLLRDQLGCSYLFKHFEQHIKDQGKQFDEDKSEDGKGKNKEYVEKACSRFFNIFFENINDISSVWKSIFPQEWKVTSENKGKLVPRIVLREFVNQFREDLCESDLRYSRVTNSLSLFPEVDQNLFTIFLALFGSCNNIELAVERELPPFGGGLRNVGDTDAKKREEGATIDIIFDYFSGYWNPLCVSEDNVAKEELQKVLDELNSQKITGFCSKKSAYEQRRKGFVKIIKMLIDKVSQNDPQ